MITVDEKFNPIFDRWLDDYGIEAQLGQLQEECAELIVAINHYKRGRTDVGRVIEESADVLGMIMQIRHVFGPRLFDDTVEDLYNKLYEKLQEKLKEDYYG